MVQIQDKADLNLRQSQRQQLHKYVFICVGLMLAGLASFPVAQLRVTRSGKYNAGPFNSQALEQAQRTELEVQP